MEIAKEDIAFVLSHAPSHTTDHEVATVLQQCMGDVAAAVATLWGASPTPTRPVRTQEQQKWDQVREIADAYDQEMKRVLANIRSSQK